MSWQSGSTKISVTKRNHFELNFYWMIVLRNWLKSSTTECLVSDCHSRWSLHDFLKNYYYKRCFTLIDNKSNLPLSIHSSGDCCDCNTVTPIRFIEVSRMFFFFQIIWRRCFNSPRWMWIAFSAEYIWRNFIQLQRPSSDRIDTKKLQFCMPLLTL